MEYIAHKNDGTTQSVKEHLENTARLAESFAIEPMKEMAYLEGLIHDLGKYADAFQDHIINGKHNKYEHSTPSAIELGKFQLTESEKLILPMLQYCVMGHHTGLPDGGADCDPADASTLHGRLKREAEYTGSSDYSAYKNEINFNFPNVDMLMKNLLSKDLREVIEKYAFFTRYLFSCLTDADFLDTEKFFSPDIDRKLKSDFNAADICLNEYKNNFPCETELQKARSRLLEQAIENSANSANISILNMPTGSGKTYCSLKLAFEKMKASGKKRIIYVIPYTSIIEQTSKTMGEIFKDNVDILRHHSNYTFEYDKNADAEEISTLQKLKKSTENWDAPIIVTTSVQFFQSLYQYRSSALRKMHNMADSVIIFDEVHLLPIKLLQPCMRAIGYIAKYLNSDMIFLSATMPDYSMLFERYMPGCVSTDLISDRSDFKYFKKCTYNYIKDASYEGIVERSQQFDSNLIIVNKKKTAREVYKMLSGNCFHLSTYMTPCDRLRVIEKIQNCLKCNQPVTVVSTSLIEAGVDLDFETVFREISGLDSILQSGGRCNREGKKENGNVYVFDTGEPVKQELEFRTGLEREFFKAGYDISADEIVDKYYKKLFKHYDEVIENISIYKDGMLPDRIPFREYADTIRLIDDESVGVVINNCEKAGEALKAISSGGLKSVRALQPYTVPLRIGEFQNARSKGIISEYANGIYVLNNNDYYKPDTGLDIDMADDKID